MMFEPFDIIISKSYAYSKDEFKTNQRWRILEELYNRNFLNDEGRNYDRLPKKIHQIWLGGKMPDKYRKYSETWQRLNPDWEYKLWGDSDALDFTMVNRGCFEKADNYGQKSDIFRYEILRKEGGLYVDTDFECLKPFSDLSYLGFLTGVGYPPKPELYIGLIACEPYHPIICHIVSEMYYVKSNGWREIFDTTGSYFFTRCFFDMVKEYCKDVLVLPTDYFYPFPNQEGHQLKRGVDYIKDCSYAVHHWAVSWIKKH